MLCWNLEFERCFNFDASYALLSSLLIPNHSGHYDTVHVIPVFMLVTLESIDQSKIHRPDWGRRKAVCCMSAVRRSA